LESLPECWYFYWFLKAQAAAVTLFLLPACLSVCLSAAVVYVLILECSNDQVSRLAGRIVVNDDGDGDGDVCS
jgi:hypothetical protein